MPATPAQLTALMIAPDRDLVREFGRSAGRVFQVLADLEAYPAPQVLEMRLRQLQPDVVLLDVASDLERAGELIRAAGAAGSAVHVIALHTKNDPEAIVHSMRLGAIEFLHAPFDPAVEEQAAARIRRLLAPPAAPPRENGKVVLFASAKPGSGASMLAAQVAFSLRQATGRKVLLADLDLMGGTISFYLRLTPHGSLLDALEPDGDLENWTSLVMPAAGLHVLAAPDAPRGEPVEGARLHEFLEHARQLYDWVILDLPAIFHRISLMALSESDLAYLVSTSDLPSLHLARKAVTLLEQLGFSRDRFHVVINRLNRRSGLRDSDMEKILNCPISGAFPNDYCSLDRALAMGKPLAPDSELSKTIESFAGRLAGVAAERRAAAPAAAARPAYSET